MSITKKFGNTRIEFKKFAENIWVKTADVGRALEYEHPIDSANNLFNRHKDELLEFSEMHQTDAGQTRFLNEQGVYIFCMLSRADKAKEFRRWVSKVLKELRQEKDLSPAEYLLAQAQRMVVLEQKGELWDLTINRHTRQLEEIHQVLLPETKVTEAQAGAIHEAVGTVAYSLDPKKPPYGLVYGRVKAQFGYSANRECPREKYPAIIKFLDSWLRSLSVGLDSFL